MKGKSGQNQALYRAIMDTSSKHGRDLTTSEYMFLGMINTTTVSKSVYRRYNNKVQYNYKIILLGNSGQKPCEAIQSPSAF